MQNDGERKRILFVERDFGNVGGSLRSLHRLVTSLDRDRYESYVTFASDRSNPILPDFEAAGCTIVFTSVRDLFRSPSSDRWRAAWQRLARIPRALKYRLIDDPRRGLELYRAIRRHSIDLVHINPGLVPYAVVAGLLAGVPVICHHRSRARLRGLGRFLSRFVAASICNSDFTRRVMKQTSLCRRMIVVHNGIAVPAAPSANPRSSGPRTVACVGRLVDWKGQHVLIRAAPGVLTELPETRFVLVGSSVGDESTSYEESLRSLVAELGLEDSVDFAGFTKDIDRMYREDFDLVVHASIEGEPFGLVLIEAMAAGVPIIASDCGACPEIIENGRSGLLVEPGNSDALAAAIVEVLSDAERAAMLRREGFERVRANFDMSQVVRGVEAVYDEVLGS